MINVSKNSSAYVLTGGVLALTLALSGCKSNSASNNGEQPQPASQTASPSPDLSQTDQSQPVQAQEPMAAANLASSAPPPAAGSYVDSSDYDEENQDTSYGQ